MSPWRKWLADFASTRVQITYAVAAVWCLLMASASLASWKAVQLMRAAPEALPVLQGIAAVISAASAAFLAVVGAWFAGKWLQQNIEDRRNGKGG
jgi:hypothetical protein